MFVTLRALLDCDRREASEDAEQEDPHSAGNKRRRGAYVMDDLA